MLFPNTSIIVGQKSIVIEHNTKVYRISFNKYFTNAVIKKLLVLIKNDRISEYDYNTKAISQEILVEFGNKSIAITKLPV